MIGRDFLVLCSDSCIDIVVYLAMEFELHCPYFYYCVHSSAEGT